MPRRFGGAPKCVICAKRVYQMELMKYDEKPYHKTCFKCLECKRTLQPSSVAMMSGTLFCKECFKKKFKARGKYDDITTVIPGTQKRSKSVTKKKFKVVKVGQRSKSLTRRAEKETRKAEVSKVEAKAPAPKPKDKPKDKPASKVKKVEAKSKSTTKTESNSGGTSAGITRVASCCCGQLKIQCMGEPVSVGVCHCYACQKRTGNVFGTQARYPKSSVKVVEGKSKTYTRIGDSGGRVLFHFCGKCGSTVYWEPDGLKEHVMVAVGAFGDNTFPSQPTVSVYDKRQHSWAAVKASGCKHID
mmetsp:Transcript_22657/g.45546  ORF Transcript_22657/g.45546 Transcript_22657/m.45546 type:complete len:301 (-) Transcript_22657:312-1214(-)